jgi:transposase
MAVALLSDPLWDLVEPFLPIPPRRPQGGRPRVSDRACLTGILFVLRSGIPWQMLPQELGCGSGMTCWRRLRDWQVAGVWDLIHFAVLDWLARDGRIDWSRAVLDSCSVRAVHGRRADRSQSHGPSEAREQASPDLRRARRAARGSSDRREPERLARSPGIGGCDSPAARRTRAAAAAAGLCTRGPRATTRRRFGAGCGRGISCHRSPCVALDTGVGWAGGGGSSSGRLRG